jgi:hypothetical protein
MNQKRRDLILNHRVRRIADNYHCGVAAVNAVLDHHPIEIDRDKYLKRELALELLHLDEIEEAFREKALEDRNVAAGTLLVKIAERRATLLGMNAPIGHALAIVQHPPKHQETSVDRIERVLRDLEEDGRKKGRAVYRDGHCSEARPSDTDQSDPDQNGTAH